MSDSAQKTLSAFELANAATHIRQVAADLNELSRADYVELERIAAALVVFARKIVVLEQRMGAVARLARPPL